MCFILISPTCSFDSYNCVCYAVEEKDEGTKTYESMAKRGVPEYNIFLRPANGTETGVASPSLFLLLL